MTIESSKISIHTLLAESDGKYRFVVLQSVQFLSTLSLRRATDCAQDAKRRAYISIHALLAESDFLAIV